MGREEDDVAAAEVEVTPRDPHDDYVSGGNNEDEEDEEEEEENEEEEEEGEASGTRARGNRVEVRNSVVAPPASLKKAAAAAKKKKKKIQKKKAQLVAQAKKKKMMMRSAAANAADAAAAAREKSRRAAAAVAAADAANREAEAAELAAQAAARAATKAGAGKLTPGRKGRKAAAAKAAVKAAKAAQEAAAAARAANEDVAVLSELLSPKAPPSPSLKASPSPSALLRRQLQQEEAEAAAAVAAAAAAAAGAGAGAGAAVSSASGDGGASSPALEGASETSFRSSRRLSQLRTAEFPPAETIRTLRKHLMTSAYNPQGVLDPARLFQRHDRDRDGVLSVGEVKMCLRRAVRFLKACFVVVCCFSRGAGGWGSRRLSTACLLPTLAGPAFLSLLWMKPPCPHLFLAVAHSVPICCASRTRMYSRLLSSARPLAYMHLGGQVPGPERKDGVEFMRRVHRTLDVDGDGKVTKGDFENFIRGASQHLPADAQDGATLAAAHAPAASSSAAAATRGAGSPPTRGGAAVAAAAAAAAAGGPASRANDGRGSGRTQKLRRGQSVVRFMEAAEARQNNSSSSSSSSSSSASPPPAHPSGEQKQQQQQQQQPEGGERLNRVTVEKLRAKIRAAAYNPRGELDVAHLFKYYDRDRDSVLRGKEISLLLAKIMPGLAGKDVLMVCELLDVDGDGNISLEDFLTFARSSADAPRPRAPPPPPSYRAH